MLLARAVPMTVTINRTLAGVVLSALLLTAAHAAAPAVKEQPRKPADRLAKAWDDLTSEDEGVASRALLTLAAAPKDAVALLKARLVPVKVDAARVKKLIEQLNDDEFDKREDAARELEYLGRFAKPHLQKALEDSPPAETKKRLTALLERIPPEGKDKEKEAPNLMGRNVSVSSRNGKIEILIDGKRLALEALAKPVVYPVNVRWLRAVRAVALLETVGSPEARAVLKKMAAGEKGAKPTDEAAAALARLEKQK
jgi:hypothetical protein